MKKLLFLNWLIAALSADAQIITIEAGMGGTTGINRVNTGPAIRVAHPQYELYRDSFEYKRKSAVALQGSVGVLFPRIGEISVGLHKGVDNTSPLFMYSRAAAMLFPDSRVSIMPYVSGSYRIRNIEQRDKGWHAGAGVQLLFWNYSKYTGKQAWYLTADHTYKHFTVVFGLKTHFAWRKQ